MIIRLDELKPICSKILFALDSSGISELTDVVQIKSEDSNVTLNVTNSEYFVTIKLPSTGINDFNATINADSFLKLIPQFTKEEVELEVVENALKVTCDGKYTLPLIYDNNNMLELPKIEIDNIKNQFDIESTVLKSILDYNSKEFNKGEIVKPVQTLYYIDEKGAITFTSGACVNSFELAEPIKILLNQKLVRLFKFFTDGVIKFTLGEDTLEGGAISQTKVRFETENICITAKIPSNETLLKSFPVEAIRKTSLIEYDYNFTLNKNALIRALNRLIIFDKNREAGCNLRFLNNMLQLANERCTENVETIEYENPIIGVPIVYETKLNLKDFKTTLENCTEQFVVIGFGNHISIMITRGNVATILPERQA